MPPRSPKRNAATVPSLIPSQSPATTPDLVRWAADAAVNIRAALLEKRWLYDDELTRLWAELARLTKALLPAQQAKEFHYNPMDVFKYQFSDELLLHVLTLLDRVGPVAQPSPRKAESTEPARPNALPTSTRVPPTGTSQGEGENPKPDYKPDGPYAPDGFRFAGVEVKFGRAGKQYRLVMALWDAKKKRPAPPRPLQDVIAEVWGEDNDTEDPAFRKLCSDVRARLQQANCPLDVVYVNGMVQVKAL